MSDLSARRKFDRYCESALNPASKRGGACRILLQFHLQILPLTRLGSQEGCRTLSKRDEAYLRFGISVSFECSFVGQDAPVAVQMTP